MTDLLMKDILGLIEAIDAIDATPIGRLDEALNKLSDRASRIRRRREHEAGSESLEPSVISARDWLAAAMRHAGMSAAEIGRLVWNDDRSVAGKIIAGNRQLGADEVLAVAKATGYPFVVKGAALTSAMRNTHSSDVEVSS